ncbi:MAG: hypothetical protein H7257_15220, partial [Taibaiella sp.]|nr:hypothetical protein [Taibaiella sp.]
MKKILSVIAMSLALYSCEKKSPEVILPETGIGAQRVFDSTRLVKNGFYHVAVTRQGITDSTICIRFVDATHFTEYKTFADSNGLVLLDSVSFAAANSYSEYQNPNPTDYKTTVGYLFTKYYPTGNGLNTFPFHNYFAADTFIL